MKQRFLRNWYFLLVIGVLLLQLIVFFIAGDAHTFIGVHDNLDIHINKKWSLRTKNKIIFFPDDENIQFNFLGTKIKIRYIYRDEKLI